MSKPGLLVSGVSKAKITEQGCKISQTDANGTRAKMGELVGWLEKGQQEKGNMRTIQ